MKTNLANLTALLVAVILVEIKPLVGQTVPKDMVLIPAGSFQMGDSFNEGKSNELPLHTVYVSEFYIDKYEVTKTLWDEVKQWANNNGYDISDRITYKAQNHPVIVVWYDAV